jgi:hypothetical protein
MNFGFSTLYFVLRTSYFVLITYYLQLNTAPAHLGNPWLLRRGYIDGPNRL